MEKKERSVNLLRYLQENVSFRWNENIKGRCSILYMKSVRNGMKVNQLFDLMWVVKGTK